MNETLLTAADVAGRLQIDKVTLQRWARQGRFPKPLKCFGRTNRWSQAQLDAFLASVSMMRGGSVGNFYA